MIKYICAQCGEEVPQSQIIEDNYEINTHTISVYKFLMGTDPVNVNRFSVLNHKPVISKKHYGAETTMICGPVKRVDEVKL